MAGGPLIEAFLANRPQLLRYLHARGAGDDAEDLLQEIWIKLGDHAGDGVAEPLAYLYRMAHNLMLDRRRGAMRRERREQGYHRDTHGEGEADDAPAAERILLAREQLRRIDRVLAALGNRTDHIFRRHRIEGIPQRDIAAELGITLSAVEKHLQKAYRAVAAAHRAYGQPDEAHPSGREAHDEPR